MLSRRKRKRIDKLEAKVKLTEVLANKAFHPCEKQPRQSNRYWTVKNYKTLKNLKIDLKIGKEIEVFQPDSYGALLKDGLCEVHGDIGDFYKHRKWMVVCEILNGFIVSGTLGRDRRSLHRR